MPGIVLYEIGIADGRSASPFVWRTKLSLARKGLAYRSEMLGLTDIPKLFDGRFATAPIIDFGDRQMNESLAIAERLDEAYRDRPAIFAGPTERSMIGFFDHWLVQLIVTHVLPIYMLDAHDCSAPKERGYYRQSREAFFGRTLEALVADREACLPDLRRALEPVRKAIEDRPFLGGQTPNFADMCLIGLFIFVGTIATLPPLAAGDPLLDYARRALSAFGPETAELSLNLSAKPL
ncbi:glutathione S-transferase N-terminal domain-containing protein [uncultured Sphingosinicella sp.]|uniref:glutathione S-transferase N-terminal domain-containing protein n=1 Tax=uncultured Sphingosinicella sp. TaxID=478748 RepID=UPI0030DA3B0C|tara:strand:+ start:18405 stop:19112 length:708 start_codon:yes stop_codon:yes gene_type:complete